MFAISIINPVNADISPLEYAKCSSKKDDLARLDCFDRLDNNKKSNDHQVQKTALKDKGKWTIRVKKNPIDDSKTVDIMLDADSGKSSYGKGVSLVVRCKSNKTEFYINWNDYLGSEAYVLTRIGNKKSKTKQWELSTDSKATFHPKETISFLKKMMNSDKFLAQVTPYNESPVTAIFSTRGMMEAIKPLRETCHWTDAQIKKKAQNRIDNPRPYLEKRLKQYKREFDSFFHMTISGTSVIQVVEGSSWKPYFRDDGAIESIVKSLELAEKASSIYPSAYFQITVNGSTYRDRTNSDGGDPFTSNELGSLTQTAINEMGWNKDKYTLIIGPEKEPKRYGKEIKYRILRGTVESTGEVVVVKILRVGK